MVFSKEARIKAALFGKLRFGNDVVHTAMQLFSAWWISNRAIAAKCHPSFRRAGLHAESSGDTPQEGASFGV
jgi:hypothetical protein